MENTVRMVVVQESFTFPDQHKDVFAFDEVLRADFTNGCEITLHLSVYDANPTFVVGKASKSGLPHKTPTPGTNRS